MKKNKKSLLVIILLTILIFIGVIGISFIYYKKTTKKIKESYSEVVSTKTKANLYDSKKRNIGTIEKDYKLELENIKNISFKDRYFKIKDTNYYVYYKDVKKDKDFINNNIGEYLLFNKNIISNRNVELLENGKTVITLNKINMPILSLDKDNYYVLFLNKVYTIKKSKFIKEKDVENTKDKETDHVSVLFYENISNDCSEQNCVTTKTFRDQLNKLKENSYSTINTDTYKKYLEGNIRLKDKTIYIIVNDLNDEIKKISDETKLKINKLEESDNFKFNSTNKTSNKDNDKNAINRYAIKSYTTIDNLLKMANGEEVYESAPNIYSGQGIPVLNYHFFYEGDEWCNEAICLEVSKFREHLEYLKNNGFKTLTMEEFTKWMYGEIDLPEKSVLITVDDGAKGTGKHNGNKLIPLLEEYKMHATLFLITGWWDRENYRSDYLDVQSHTNNMHQYGPCGRGELNCATYDEAVADLKQSLTIADNNNSFCFPFYMTSDTSLRAVKDVGFKIAFVGGNVDAKRTNNKWLIPRYPIQSDITLNQFINIVN